MRVPGHDFSGAGAFILAVSIVLTAASASALYPQASGSGGSFNLSLTNETDPFAVPYKPGIDFDNIRLGDSGSIQSRFPTASVSVRSQGTAGQVSTVSLDGGLPSHTQMALDGLVIESGQTRPLDAGLLPFELAGSVDVFKNNLSPFGILAPGGLLNFNIESPGYDNNRVGVYAGSYWNLGLKGLFNRRLGDSVLTLGGFVTFASNDFAYVDPFGATNRAQNEDYWKYGAVAKYRGGIFRVNLTHTGKFAGTGDRYSGGARQADLLSTLDFRLDPGAFSAGLTYVNWVNSYTNPLLGQGDLHVNHTLGCGGSTTLRLGSNYTAKVSLRDTAFWLDSTKVGDRFSDAAEAVIDQALTIGKFDAGVSLNNLADARYGYYPVYSVSAGVYPLEGLYLSGSFSRQFRLPTFNEVYWPSDGYSRGNPGLAPEDGVQWKAGCLWAPLPFVMSVSYSESYMNGLILWAPDSGGVWAPSNQGRVTARVGNATLLYDNAQGDVALRAELSASLNLTLNDDPSSRYYGKRVIYIPLYKLAVNLHGSWKGGIGANVSLRWCGDRYTTELNTVSLPPYLLLDAGVNWGYLFVMAENILDAQYQEVEGCPQMGRSFRAGVNIEW